ncbi:MAG: hypothetical protein ACO3JG_04650 [Luteolibacter sp.]
MKLNRDCIMAPERTHPDSSEEHPASGAGESIEPKADGCCPFTHFFKHVREVAIDDSAGTVRIEFDGGWLETIRIRPGGILEHQTSRAQFLEMISEAVAKIGALGYDKGRMDARDAMLDAVRTVF